MNEFTWPVRVYYEDTDAGGVVYYANYLKYLERARTEWLRSLGFEQDKLVQEDGVIFAVRKVIIDYMKPAVFNELLAVNAKILEIRKASLLFEQSITNQLKDILCRAEIRIACLDTKTMKPVSIPEHILSELDHVN
ncbi:MAG: tol-pal system-associated acyl-CoA thioesterase [Gammaproteobacteria bacterium]|nr:tol-pal system-associated acyl-CoA thioesterase [Gammaproteobacteria bacterium]